MSDEGSGQLSEEELAQLNKVFAIVEVWRQRTHTAAPESEPGSSLAGDDEATKPRQLSHAVVGALVSAVDHLDALRALVRDAHVLHARAPFTLLRAALENAAIAVWLLAPANRNERVLRLLRLHWADENDHIKALKLMEAVVNGKLEEIKTELRKIAKDRGLREDQVLKVTDRPVSWSSITETAGEEGDGLKGRGALWSWMVSSGIAHARLWAVLAILQKTETRPPSGDVAHLEIRASTTGVVAIAQIAAVMLAEGFRLFDQRRQAHRYRS